MFQRFLGWTLGMVSALGFLVRAPLAIGDYFRYRRMTRM